MYRIVPPLLIAFALAASCGIVLADTVPPKPSLYLFLERTTIREEDTVHGEIWLGNESDVPITATAHYTAPGFLMLLDRGARVRALPLGSIAPHGVVRREIALASAADIMVGAFQVSLTVDYAWGGAAPGHSFVTAEKGVSMNLLGTDSIAGVPLALAGFIVPGLLFWVVLRLFGVSWADRQIGEITLYSIPVSLLFMFVGQYVGPLDARGGMGVMKLVLLALGGGALGAIVGLMALLRRRGRKRREEGLVIADSDDMPVLIGKLAARCRYDGPKKMRVTLKSGPQYTGSWVVRHGGYTYLFGAFYIDATSLPEAMLDDLRHADGLTDHHARLVALLEVVARAARGGGDPKSMFLDLTLARRVVAGSEGADVVDARDHYRWADEDAPDASPVDGTAEPLVQVDYG